MSEGTVLRDRYRLERLLGRGGMADVYLAFDLRRQVHIAVKLLREDLAEDPEFLQRFQREAEALARLDHPYIVRFYSFERQRPIAFIVMDYVPGITLRTRLLEAGGPLPLAEVTQILRQIGSALQYAHNEGFIHRDIKPGNIMLRPDGSALLSDFGIARAVAAMTMTMAPLGTPAYMSPEQILGHEADPRTDVYCLGVVLYEMVTGRRPFAGDSGTGTMSAERVRAEHLHVPPRDPRSLNPSLPTAASQVILRALAKNPAQRWPNMTALVQAWEAAVGAPQAADASSSPAARLNRIPVTGPVTPPRQREPLTAPPAVAPAPKRSGLSWLLWVVAALFAVLFLVVVAVLFRSLSSSGSADASAVAQQQTLDARTQQTAIALAADWSTATASASGQQQPAGEPNPSQEQPTSAPTEPAATPTPLAAATAADEAATVAAADAQAKLTAEAEALLQATATAAAAETAAREAQDAAATEQARLAEEQTAATAAAATAAADATAKAEAEATAVSAAATATAQAAASEPPGVLTGFESSLAWRRGDEPYGDLVRGSEQVHSGSYSGKLAYAFPAVNNNYVVFSPRPAIGMGGTPAGISAWVYGDGSSHFLNAWVQDSAGEVRQYTFGQITFVGWQQVYAPFDEQAGWPNSHISGPDSGSLDYPVSLYAIVLDGVPDGQASSGAIYIDDIAGY